MKSWENCGNTESEMCGNRESEMCGNTMRGNVFVADKVLTHYPEITCLSLPGKQIKTEQTQNMFFIQISNLYQPPGRVQSTILRVRLTQVKAVNIMIYHIEISIRSGYY